MILCLLLLATIVLSIGSGVIKISPTQLAGILGKSVGLNTSISFSDQQETILTVIRLPRILLAILTGATLATAGAAIQALFRNPLADPALIGISSGASVTAVLFIVTAHHLLGQLSAIAGGYALSAITFLGAFISTTIIYSLSQVNGKTVISIMLLAGIAINAFTGATTGLFTYAASDAQLRSITFWALGSLGGATWQSLAGVAPFMLVAILTLPMMGKSLNGFSLGETNAQLLGINTERTKRMVILLAAMSVGASVSVTGVIGFVGLVVPHIIRTLTGPDNKNLILLSALTGALLVSLADLAARTLFAPAEMPIGIITAIIGAPFFLYLLLKDRRSQQLA